MTYKAITGWSIDFYRSNYRSSMERQFAADKDDALSRKFFMLRNEIQEIF
jgi:hypothetical protein